MSSYRVGSLVGIFGFLVIAAGSLVIEHPASAIPAVVGGLIIGGISYLLDRFTVKPS